MRFFKKLALIVFIVTIFTQNLIANEILRVATVNTPGYTGLMDMLVSEFKKENKGVEIKLHSSSSPHYEALEGRADLVISHYGKSEMEPFIMDGFGYFPKMLFANQAAIIGPKDDPAGIRGLNAVEAYKKLVNSDVIFVTNYLKGALYLDEYLQALSGAKEALIKKNSTVTAKEQTAKIAEELNAYFIWGAFPFLRYQEKNNSKLELLVLDDSVLQRVMSSTVVKSSKIEGANEVLAKKFQDFIIRPDVQAKIAKFHVKNSNAQLWWPYAKHN